MNCFFLPKRLNGSIQVHSVHPPELREGEGGLSNFGNLPKEGGGGGWEKMLGGGGGGGRKNILEGGVIFSERRLQLFPNYFLTT